MSQLSDEISRAYAAVSSVLGSLSDLSPSSSPVFTWNGADYDAISAIQGEAELFGAGGLAPDFSLTLTVNLSVFSSDRPHPKQYVVYPPSGRQYKIQTVDTTPDGSGIIIKANDPNRGTGIIEREW